MIFMISPESAGQKKTPDARAGRFIAVRHTVSQSLKPAATPTIKPVMEESEGQASFSALVFR